MKRRDLIKLLETNGWYLKRSGGNHDLYTDGERTEPIPRHSEIKEMLAKKYYQETGALSPGLDDKNLLMGYGYMKGFEKEEKR